MTKNQGSGELDVEALMAFIEEHEHDPVTRRRYRLAWGRFCTWCTEEGVDPYEPGPEAATNHLAYLGWLTDPVNPAGLGFGSMGRELAAISHHRKEAGLEVQMQSAHRTLEGALKGDDRQRQEELAPITADVLAAIMRDPTPTGEGIARQTALLVARAAAVLPAQLLPMTGADLLLGATSATLRLPTTYRSGETVLASAQTISVDQHPEPALCPVRALRQLAAFTGGGPPFQALWGPQDDGGPGSADWLRRAYRKHGRRLGLEGLNPIPFPNATDAELRCLLTRLDPAVMKARLAQAYIALGRAGGLDAPELTALAMTDIARTDKGIEIGVDRASKGRAVVVIPWAKDPAICPVRALDRWIETRGAEPGPLFTHVRQGLVRLDRPVDSQSGWKMIKSLTEGLPGRFGLRSMVLGFVQEQADLGKTATQIWANLSPHDLDAVAGMMGTQAVARREATTLLGGLL